MARFRKRYRKRNNGFNASSVGNQLAKENVKAQRKIQRGSFF